MYSRLRTAALRVNWKGWTAISITTSSILTQSSIAICDNHNINDNHLTPFLTKQIGPNEFVVQSEDHTDIHLKRYKKAENTYLEWGMHCNGKSPKKNSFFEKIKLKIVKFSSNVQVALDVNGNLYCKYNNDEWMKVNDFQKIKDVAITNDVIYLIDGKGHLFQLQYHRLPNKYDDPCIDKSLMRTKKATMKYPLHTEEMERNIQNCLDHRRKKSFSSMPMSNYHKYLKDQYEWNTTKEFVDYLCSEYNNNQFELNDVNDEMYKEELIKVYANDYRVFTISDKGNVYVRGDNQRGACGVPPELYIPQFTKINSKYFDSPVIDIGIGEDHTIFLTQVGRIFSCGSDNLMQLGLGWTKRKCIKSDSNWTKIGQEGFKYTAKQFDNNIEIEDDKDDEYFHEVPSYDEFYPRVITGPFFDDSKVTSISCGDYHCAVIIEPLYSLANPLKRHHREIDSLTEKEIQELKRELIANRRVITWGCGLQGQLGHCNFTNASEPKPVKPLEQYKEFNQEINEIVKIKPIEIQCGKEHTLVLMEGYTDFESNDENASDSNKMVFAFGNNRYNQVSKKKKPKQSSPYWIQSILPQKVSIDYIAAGNFQSAAFGHYNDTQFQY